MYVTKDLTDSTALIHNSMIDYLSHSSHMCKMYQRFYYLVQHLSPKMLAHYMDKLLLVSLQCHLISTKQIKVKFFSENVYFSVMCKQTCTYS